MSNEDFFGTNVNTGVTAGEMPDMDALFEQAVNQEEVRQVQSDALKPQGSYITEPILSLSATRAEVGENSILAKPSADGKRLVFRFFGPASLTVTEKNTGSLKLPVGSIVRGQFGFGISPDRANSVKNGVDSGAPDGNSQRWAQAVKAYEQAYKSKPQTTGDVVRYLQGYPVVIRVIQIGVPSDRNPEPTGEPGNIVMALSAVRETGV